MGALTKREFTGTYSKFGFGMFEKHTCIYIYIRIYIIIYMYTYIYIEIDMLLLLRIKHGVMERHHLPW